MKALPFGGCLALLMLLLAGCGPAPGSAAKSASPAKKKTKAPAPLPPTPPLDVTPTSYASIPACLSAIAQATDANDSREIRKCEAWLELQGPSAVPQLQAAVLDKATHLGARIAGCRVLPRLGSAATPALIAALASEPQQLRLKAAESLGRIKPADPAAVKKLIELLDAKDDRLKVAVMTGLSGAGQAAGDATPKLMAILNDPQADETVRSAAKAALKNVDPRKGLMGLAEEGKKK